MEFWCLWIIFSELVECLKEVPILNSWTFNTLTVSDEYEMNCFNVRKFIDVGADVNILVQMKSSL